ncbi:hypothetical protein DL764_006813 [Monosporascus ibericus]|uniref:Uncharacterized protein n=1 Tax=Monosporascus ibericus TaxID=155417 RepID=A0A4Q4T438_9PEZI|nr:hypothetical protein DL764_006813 [Monosporascus ibericus]
MTDGPIGSTRDRGYADDRHRVPASWPEAVAQPRHRWRPGCVHGQPVATPRGPGPKRRPRPERHGAETPPPEDQILYPGEVAVGHARCDREQFAAVFWEVEFLLALFFPPLISSGYPHAGNGIVSFADHTFPARPSQPTHRATNTCLPGCQEAAVFHSFDPLGLGEFAYA